MYKETNRGLLTPGPRLYGQLQMWPHLCLLWRGPKSLRPPVSPLLVPLPELNTKIIHYLQPPISHGYCPSRWGQPAPNHLKLTVVLMIVPVVSRHPDRDDGEDGTRPTAGVSNW